MNRWFHPEFETDLISAARYIEKERGGFGAQFLDEAERAVEAIVAAPLRWPPKLGDVRRFIVQRFHYVIRYRVVVVTETVEFLSIVHTSRKPGTAEDR